MADEQEYVEPDGVQELTKLREDNKRKFDSLRAQGVGLDPSSVMMLRLDTLINMALSADDRIRFETQFESAMSDALDDTLKQVRQATLMQGVPPAGSGIVLGPDGSPAK